MHVDVYTTVCIRTQCHTHTRRESSKHNYHNISPRVMMKAVREFQTQLLHYFSKSDNKSNHHHHHRTLHVGFSDVSPKVDTRHLEGPNNPDKLILGVHVLAYMYKVHMCIYARGSGV